MVSATVQVAREAVAPIPSVPQLSEQMFLNFGQKFSTQYFQLVQILVIFWNRSSDEALWYFDSGHYSSYTEPHDSDYY